MFVRDHPRRFFLSFGGVMTLLVAGGAMFLGVLTAGMSGTGNTPAEVRDMKQTGIALMVAAGLTVVARVVYVVARNRHDRASAESAVASR
ncbi:MAG: hypothetical protein U0W40_00235 [Acidimicrobiia bacterium]